jgi:general stress protein CsbA
MLDMKALQTAALTGTILQLIMIAAGHFSPWVAMNVFMIGGMAISAIAGFLYARSAARGYPGGALGGAIAGGVCALIGIAASVALGDTAAIILAFGTVGSTVAGAMGGVVGQMLSTSRVAS